MNKQRKTEIKKIALRLQGINKDLQKILDDEQDYYDNIPENLQSSSRADDSEEAIDQLTEAVEEIEEIVGTLTTI